jgi:DNA-binding LacI/PurR family transcriptional regulator
VEIILNEIKKKDYDLVLFSVDEDKPGVSYLRMCEERAVDGAIFIGFGEVDEHLEEIKNFEIPVVFIERNIKSKLSSIITTDNRKAMKIGIEYLIRIGHKEIGFLKGTKNSEVAKLRELYFKEIMKEKELLKEEYIFDSDFSIESGYNVAAKLLELDKMPTAIFTSSDLSAIGLIRGLKDCQIDVPNDISILGFDGFKISNFTIPRLTTIEQDFYSLGINAINILFDMIENKIVSKEIIKIPPKLIIRESTKPLLTD